MSAIVFSLWLVGCHFFLSLFLSFSLSISVPSLYWWVFLLCNFLLLLLLLLCLYLSWYFKSLYLSIFASATMSIAITLISISSNSLFPFLSSLSSLAYFFLVFLIQSLTHTNKCTHTWHPFYIRASFCFMSSKFSDQMIKVTFYFSWCIFIVNNDLISIRFIA